MKRMLLQALYNDYMTTLSGPQLPPFPESASSPLAEETVFDVAGVSWESYESLRRDWDHTNIRMTYDRGRLVARSPLPKHGKIETLLGRMIETMALELEIPISGFGSTTWRKQELLKGLEPDECYYVQNEPLVHARDDIDLRRDPPPDLAIEVDITHHPMDRMSIYAALGMKEIWLFSGTGLRAFRLDADHYTDTEFSVAFPFVRVSDLSRFLEMYSTDGEFSMMRAFRTWLGTLKR